MLKKQTVIRLVPAAAPAGRRNPSLGGRWAGAGKGCRAQVGAGAALLSQTPRQARVQRRTDQGNGSRGLPRKGDARVYVETADDGADPLQRTALVSARRFASSGPSRIPHLPQAAARGRAVHLRPYRSCSTKQPPLHKNYPHRSNNPQGNQTQPVPVPSVNGPCVPSLAFPGSTPPV